MYVKNKLCFCFGGGGVGGHWKTTRDQIDFLLIQTQVAVEFGG